MKVELTPFFRIKQKQNHLQQIKQFSHTITNIVENNDIGLQAYPKSYYLISFGQIKKQDDNDPISKLEWAKNWNYEKRREEIAAETENSIRAMSWSKRNLTSAPKRLRQAATTKLQLEQETVTAILQLATNIQGKIDDLTSQAQQDEATKQQIKTERQKLANLNAIQETLTKFKTNQGGLDDVIAGYDAEKEILRTNFIKPLALEKTRIENGEEPIDIPPSILLYGCIGTGKTTFARALAKETGCELIEITPRRDNFAEEIEKHLNRAEERYNETGERTVIIVNEIDKYLEENNDNKLNIGLIKNVLDNCSKLPGGEFDNACATSFIFTTNHPLDISDEILPREEKVPIKLALEPADNENFKQVLKFHIKKADPNKEHFDYEKINYDEFAEKYKPDGELGAFSNDKIRVIVKKSYENYLVNNEISFEDHLKNRFEKAKRDIKPDRLQQYYDDLEELDED